MVLTTMQRDMLLAAVEFYSAAVDRSSIDKSFKQDQLRRMQEALERADTITLEEAACSIRPFVPTSSLDF